VRACVPACVRACVRAWTLLPRSRGPSYLRCASSGRAHRVGESRRGGYRGPGAASCPPLGPRAPSGVARATAPSVPSGIGPAWGGPGPAAAASSPSSSGAVRPASAPAPAHSVAPPSHSPRRRAAEHQLPPAAAATATVTRARALPLAGLLRRSSRSGLGERCAAAASASGCASPSTGRNPDAQRAAASLRPGSQYQAMWKARRGRGPTAPEAPRARPSSQLMPPARHSLTTRPGDGDSPSTLAFHPRLPPTPSTHAPDDSQPSPTRRSPGSLVQLACRGDRLPGAPHRQLAFNFINLSTSFRPSAALSLPASTCHSFFQPNLNPPLNSQCLDRTPESTLAPLLRQKLPV
jgi:hypothetical protein